MSQEKERSSVKMEEGWGRRKHKSVISLRSNRIQGGDYNHGRCGRHKSNQAIYSYRFLNTYPTLCS